MVYSFKGKTSPLKEDNPYFFDFTELNNQVLEVQAMHFRTLHFFVECERLIFEPTSKDLISDDTLFLFFKKYYHDIIGMVYSTNPII